MLDWILEKLDTGRLLTQTVEFLPQLFAALVVLIAFWMIFRVSRRPLGGLLRSAGLHDKLVDLLVGSIYRYTLLILGLVMALDQVGMNVGAALASIGVAGIAIGFAAQDSLANLISGIMIFWDKPFVVGDWITAEGEYGKVSDITLRTTRIRTPRNTWVVIPNRQIIDSVLENHSKHGELRVDVAIGIAYKEDVGQARGVLLEAVQEIEGILDEPASDVVVTALGNSSVDLAVRVWVDAAKDERRISFQILELGKKALDEAGIQIPFPHLQLFVDAVEDPVWKGAARHLLPQSGNGH